MKTPADVMATTTPRIKKLISEILKYETEFQHFKNLPKEKEKLLKQLHEALDGQRQLRPEHLRGL